ncbi:carboxypeptidase-like regulatory domain-containing protein, partial [Aquiflexum sp.]|uniref:STN domain-containing protein n=1 Tax=Aquiflexum sp. TaxID=1872584 RepID=UPI00359441F7
MKNRLLLHVIYMTKLFTYAFLIQCLTMSFLLAWNGNAQIKGIDEVMIRIPLEGVSVEKAFSEIEKSTGFNFVYTNKELKNLTNVSVNGNHQTLYDVLVILAQQTNLQFKQVNENIHVKKSSVKKDTPFEMISIVLEDITVAGTVVDENGEPLPGATVTVAGTTTGTVTDLDGNYSLTVPENSVIVFSF